jgi:hypothetical protein
MTNTRFISSLLVLLLTTSVAGAQLYQPDDLTYLGVFAPAQYSGSGVRYGSGMYGMEYDPTCAGQPDPSPNDGYPGCLAATSHKAYDMIGMFDVVPPTLSHESDYNLVPKAEEVVGFFKCSIRADGTDIQDELNEEPDWKARDIPGLVRSPDGDWLCMCGHDWYDVSHVDYDSHCWFEFNPDAPNAVGPYGIGEAGDDDYHSQRTSWYLGTIPQAWADENLSAEGSPYCFSGMQREGGGTYSTGPTIYAFECSEPLIAPRGPLDATLLLGYPRCTPISLDPNPCSPYPHFYPNRGAREIEWVGDTVLVVESTSGPFWWYGPGDPYDPEKSQSHRGYSETGLCSFNYGEPDPCFLERGPMLPPGTVNTCNPSSKGYQSLRTPDGTTGGQSVASLRFFAASELADVVSGSKLPEEVMPYAGIEDIPGFWSEACKYVHGSAYDPATSRLYLIESNGEYPLVHVYSLGEGEPVPYCGDGTCDPGEDYENCPNDCPPPEPEQKSCEELRADLEVWLSSYECEVIE